MLLFRHDKAAEASRNNYAAAACQMNCEIGKIIKLDNASILREVHSSEGINLRKAAESFLNPLVDVEDA